MTDVEMGQSGNPRNRQDWVRPAKINLDTGASYIYHEAAKRYPPINFSVRDRDPGSTAAEAQERIARNVKPPTGYRPVWAGAFQDLQLVHRSRIAESIMRRSAAVRG